MKMVWRHASTSGGLLRSEVSRARVSQFGLKTGGGAAADGARGIIVKVSCGEEKDGRFDSVGCGAGKIGPNYPLIAVIFISSHRGI